MVSFKQFVTERQNATLEGLRRAVASELRAYDVETSDINSFVVTERSSKAKAQVRMTGRSIVVKRFPSVDNREFLEVPVDEVEMGSLIEAIRQALQKK